MVGRNDMRASAVSFSLAEEARACGEDRRRSREGAKDGKKNGRAD